MDIGHYSSDQQFAMEKLIVGILENVGKPISKKQLDRELRYLVSVSLSSLINGGVPPVKLFQRVIRFRKGRRIFFSTGLR